MAERHQNKGPDSWD